MIHVEKNLLFLSAPNPLLGCYNIHGFSQEITHYLKNAKSIHDPHLHLWKHFSPIKLNSRPERGHHTKVTATQMLCILPVD